MSVYPLMLEGSALSAVIIGGGAVAARKAKALLAAGADVGVVAPEIAPEIEHLATTTSLRITRERYSSRHLDGALLVIAATDSDSTNSQIALDARARGRLVNVAGSPNEGTCITPAVHRAGDVVVAVTAGGVPAAAARIRDDIAGKIDVRYADAMRELSSLRRALIDGDDRGKWLSAAAALIGENFCDRVESGQFAEALAEWR